jgi:hypothetical protein
MRLPYWKFFDQNILAKSDPEAAAKALLAVAEHLRTGGTSHPEVIEFIAGAIEKSMALDQKKRGPALLRALNLTYGNRRPVKASFHDVGRAFDILIASGKTRKQAITELKAKFVVSESTIVRCTREYRHYELENELWNAELLKEKE